MSVFRLTSSFPHTAHECFSRVLLLCMCVHVLPVFVCVRVCACVCACVCGSVFSCCTLERRLQGDPGVIGLVTTRTMWHLQVSAVPLPAELAWSQLELCHVEWPQLKCPFWDWSRVGGSTAYTTNISLNANLLYFRWKKNKSRQKERCYMTSILNIILNCRHKRSFSSHSLTRTYK